MKTRARNCGLLFLSLLLLAPLTGCLAQGSGEPLAIVKSVVPVTGTIRYADGHPVANAWVVFHPLDPPGNEASGATESDGTFRLGTFAKEDGAVPGRYVVTIEPHPNVKKNLPSIPKKYTSEKTSTYTVEVMNAGPVTLDPFKLK
jgi:hypothetical protein